jgi:hypothetical protein
MAAVPWLVMLASSVLLGAGVAAALALPRRFDILAMALTAALAVVGYRGFAAIVEPLGRNDIAIATAALAVGAILGGYALAATSLALLAVRAPEGPPIAVSGTGDRLGVIVLSGAEPAHYDPVALAEEFTGYTDDEVPLPNDLARPLFYAAEKGGYRTIGASDGMPCAGRVAARLGDLLAADGVAAEVRAASAGRIGRLADTVHELAQEGCATIVVVPLGCGWSRRMDRAFAAAESRLSADGAPDLRRAPGVWMDEGVAHMVAGRVERLTDGRRDWVGVVLVSQGEPIQATRLEPEAGAHERSFRSRVAALLESRGYRRHLVVDAFSEWEEPDVGDAIEHLGDQGVSSILVCPATIPADGLATLVDARMQADRAKVHPDIEVSILPAWGDDPAVATALRAVVDGCLRR